MKLPIEAVVVLLKNTIRRVFDEKLALGIRRRSQNKFFVILAASWLLFWHEIIFFGNFILAVNRSVVEQEVD